MDLSDLRSRLAAGKLFHAYIVTGGNAETRESAGQLIARAAVCAAPSGAPCGVCRDCAKALRGVHPDIETVDRTAREHTVDSLREVRSRVAVVPNEAARSVFLIRDADAMNVPAQNAMLKIFEEPPAHAVFVLLAENPQRLLETVRSRCETVNLTPTPTKAQSETDAAARAVIDALSRRDDLALIRALAPVDKLNRETVPAFTESLRRLAMEAFAAGKLTEDTVERLSETLDKADKMTAVNVSAAHIASWMLAKLCAEET